MNSTHVQEQSAQKNSSAMMTQILALPRFWRLSFTRQRRLFSAHCVNSLNFFLGDKKSKRKNDSFFLQFLKFSGKIARQRQRNEPLFVECLFYSFLNAVNNAQERLFIKRSPINDDVVVSPSRFCASSSRDTDNVNHSSGDSLIALRTE